MSEAVGKKDSQDKLRLDLVPTEAIEGLSLALMNGIKKYGEHNWRLGLSYSDIYGAAQRHLQKFWNTDKPDIDKDSGLPHLYHTICNVAFLIAYEENKERYCAFDDRFKNPPHTVDRPKFPDLTKMTHPEACEHLKVGMKVRILRSCKSNKQKGWMSGWTGKMQMFVGTEAIVKIISPDINEGIEFIGDDKNWMFPAFVLEIVDNGE